jgi:hypothetical protein
VTSSIEARVCDAVGRHPAVSDIDLVGSRARGDATLLSDWDFKVETDDFENLAAALPRLTEPLQPIATMWDPLARHATFQVIVHGPTMVDLLFDEPWEPSPPYTVTGENLAAIDAHLWDWCLWLGSKHLAGKKRLVTDELRKMARHILRPMGVVDTPGDLPAAIDAYRSARTDRENQLHTEVSRLLESEVCQALAEHDILVR